MSKSIKEAYYYDNTGNYQLINLDDAVQKTKDGVSLCNCIYEKESFDKGVFVPLKFIMRKSARPYFARKATKVKYNGRKITKDKSPKLTFITKIRTLYSKDIIKPYNLGGFKFTSKEIEEIVYSERVNGDYKLLPDVTIRTAFMDFYIYLKTRTSVITKEVLDKYKDHYNILRANNSKLFTVVEIDLSDLYAIAKENNEITCGVYDFIKKRLYESNEYMRVFPMITLRLEDAPFGYSVRTGLPFNLIINSYADGVSKEVREVANELNCMGIISYLEDGLHSLFLRDYSAEKPLIPLDCPIHEEEPLRLLYDRLGDEYFIKCHLHMFKHAGNKCEFIVRMFNSKYELSPEYLVCGRIYNFRSSKCLYRLQSLRNAHFSYKELMKKYED